MKLLFENGGHKMVFNAEDKYWVTQSMLFPGRLKVIIGEDSYVTIFDVATNKIKHTLNLTGNELICQLFDYIGCEADFE